MVESIAIDNFRCFKTLGLHGLRSVNIVVGDSGSGKTALMEAVFLAASSNPQVPLTFRRWRGMGTQIQIKNTRASFEGLFRDLFFDLNADAPVAISLVGSENSTRGVRVFFKEEGGQLISVPDSTTQLTGAMRPVVFEWTDVNGNTQTSEVKFAINEGKASLVMNPTLGSTACHFFNSISLFDSPTEPSDQFSQLSQAGQIGLIVDALKEIYPINNLNLEIVAGTTVVCASIPGRSFKPPIPLLSAGATKLMNILLGIASAGAGGIVLIDEIENGFYFRSLPKIWETILKFSKTFSVQVFATTHSHECLSAAVPVIKDNESSFCYLRARRGGVIDQTDGSGLVALLEDGFEAR